jgi:glycosyltransferase involved in cell wall biosynthesis
MSKRMGDRDLLLDVSRLIWRVWRGSLPTGIDRVCLAYLRYYGPRALAVVQRRGAYFVLPEHESDRLFDILLGGGVRARKALIKLALRSALRARRNPPGPGMYYLNVGHTGLDEPSLPGWIARHRVRAAVMIHDLIPITHPQFCRPGEAAKHRQRMRNVLASARGVIANSKATLDDFTDFAASEGRDAPDSVVAWLGVDVLWDEIRPKRLNVPHFVTIGTIEGRKNHILLLQVWRRLVETLGDAAPKLVIIGQRGWQAQAVFDLLDGPDAMNDHVLELGGCSDSELAGWMAGAEALLMPSFAEGFGLPVVEALRMGTAVVASDLAALREVGGNAATYLDPCDDLAWQDAIVSLAATPKEHRGEASLHGFYRAPDWHSHFAIVDEWLGSLQAKPG